MKRTRRPLLAAALTAGLVAGIAVSVRALTFSPQTWDFPNNVSTFPLAIGQYQISDSNRIEFTNAGSPVATVARLKSITATNSQSSQATFSGTMTGVQWDTEFPGLRLTPSTGATAELTSGVPGAVGLWHLNSTLNDVAGADNALVLPGGASDPTVLAGAGKWGTSTYVFSASQGDYLSTPASAELEPASAVTVQTWVKFTSLTGQQGLLTKYATFTGTLKPAYALVKTSDTDPLAPNRLQFLVGNTTTTLTVTGNTTVAANIWYHVAGTYDGTKATLYVNGLQDAVPVNGAFALAYSDWGPTYMPMSANFPGWTSSNSIVSNPTTFGTEFTANMSGRVTQLCTYAPTSGGTPRVINLSTAAGGLLGNVSAASNGSSYVCGTLASPIALTAGQSYVVWEVHSFGSTAGYYNRDVPAMPFTPAGNSSITFVRAKQGSNSASFPGGTISPNTVIRGIPEVVFQMLVTGPMEVGRFTTTAGGPYAHLDGYLDEVLVSNQALSAANIRAYGGYTFPTSGSYLSPVIDSTTSTVPVNRWRSLTWGELPVSNLGDEFTPNLMSIRPENLWHFSEGAGQTVANATVPPASATPLQAVNPGTPLTFNLGASYVQGGYAFTTPAWPVKTVQRLGGMWLTCAPSQCGSSTRKVILYDAAGTQLAYADATSTGNWSYADLKTPAGAPLSSLALAPNTTYVVAVVTANPSNLQRITRASATVPFNAGGVRVIESRLMTSGSYSETMPPATSSGVIYGMPDVQFTAAGGGGGDVLLGTTALVETVDPAWTAAGRFGKALLFNSAEFDRATLSSSNVNATDNWTIEAWVYYDGTGGGTSGTFGASLVFVGNSNGTTGFGLMRGTATTNVNEISVRYGFGGLSFNQLSTGVPYDLNAWNHIAVVRRAGVLEVYKNGLRIGPDVSPVDGLPDDLDGASPPPTAPSVLDTITLGNLANGTASFGGVLDEVAIYASPLTSTQIASDYRQGASRLTLQMRTGPTAVPDASWTEWRPAAGFLPSMAAPLQVPPDRFGLTGLYHGENIASLSLADAWGIGTNMNNNGGGLPGSVANRPTQVVGQAGFNNAMNFDGNDYITIGNFADVGTATGALAVECWVRPTAYSGTNYVVNKAGAYGLYLAGGVPTFNVTGVGSAAAGSALSTNVWHHLMGTYDTGRLNLYVDGALANAQTGAVVTVTSASTIIVGAQDNTAANGFQGVMDEIALYNRVPSDAPFIQSAQAIGANPGLQGVIDNNTYAQVRADFLSFDSSQSPQLTGLTTTAQTYPVDKPWVRNLASAPAPDFNALQTFTETQGPTTGLIPVTFGTVGYQITNDATGASWYYFSGGSWVPATTSAQTNPASVVNANLALFPAQVGMGKLFWKAFLDSNGDQQVVLDALSTQVAVTSLALTPPAPGTVWYLGTTHPVTWTASGLNNVKLEYDNDGSGTFDTTIVGSVAASAGTFDWPVPQNFGLVSMPGAARIRISALDQYGTHISDTQSGYTVGAPTFAITVPGMQFPVQTTQRVTWTTTGAPIGNSLKLEYVKGGASGAATLIANIQNTLNNCAVNPPASGGCYDWFVPNAAVGPQVRLRLTDNGQALTTGDSADFKVTGSLTVAMPDGSMPWTVGQPHQVQWTTKGTIPQVLIKYNGAPISGGPVNNTGSFMWTTSTPADAHAAGVFRVEDASDTTVFGDSPAIRITTAAVTSPTAASRWLAGSGQAITWTHTALNAVRLSYAVGGGADTEIVASVPASPSTYPWTIPLTAVKRNGVTVRVQDAEQSQAEFQAVATSAPFTVHGVLGFTQPSVIEPTNFTCTAGSGSPCALTWTTTGSIAQVDVAYTLDNNTFVPIVAGLANTDSYNWVPNVTAPFIKVRVRDAQDDQTESISGGFAIDGIGLSAPVGGPIWNVGTTQTISWSKTGSFNNVDLHYTVDGSTWLPIVLNLLTNDTGSHDWLVPDAISTSARVRIMKSGDPALAATSDPFSIRGVLAVTSPNGGGAPLKVSEASAIAWTAIGTMPKIRLDLSVNAGGSWPVAIATLTNALGGGTSPVANSYAWTVPDAITHQARIRVMDNDLPAHPASLDISDGDFVIQAAFAITAPSATGWGVNELKPITWSTTGTVGRVTVEYSTDGSSWIVAQDDLGTPASNILNLGSFVWKVPDVVSPQVIAAGKVPGDGSAINEHKVQTMLLRIQDVDPLHAPAARAVHPMPAPFTVKWFRIQWSVLNPDLAPPNDNHAQLNVVDDATLAPQWIVDNLDCTASGTPCLNSPLYRHYPYGIWTTQWIKKNFTPAAVSVEAVRDGTAGGSGASARDRINTVYLSSSIPDPTVYQVRVDQAYVTSTDTLTFKVWLEKQGQIPTNASVFGDATLKIYDGLGPPVVSQTVNASADPLWEKDYTFTLSPTGLIPGKLYFAKLSVMYEAKERTSGGTVNLLLPSNQAVTLADLQNELSPIETQVGEIHTETVGPASTLQTIVSNQTTIRNDIATAKTDIQADVAGVAGQVGALQGTADAIKLDTGLIGTQVLPGLTSIESKVDGVQAYLADPNTGLPKIIANTDNLANAAKAARRGGLLSRDLSLDVGETVTIQYRGEGGALSVQLYNQAGAPVAGLLPLSLNPATGLYETTFTASAAGEFRAVVTEAASADSSGTVDSLTMTVRAPRATAQAVSGVQTSLDALTTQLSAIESDVDGLVLTAATIQATTDATKLQADSIKADATALLAKWGALEADDLMTGINGLAADLGAVRAKTDTINWADIAAIQADVTQVLADTSNIAAIKTRTDTINWADVTGLVTTAGAIQAKTDTINWADVTAVKTKTDTINWADVTGIKAQTDTISWADVLGIKAQTDTINWANVLTVMNEIGVGNIAAIRTATDTINWADVTGLVTTAGTIQAKTDTINWADVTGIKTATDTINWADITDIQTQTDTINWADVTALGTAVAQVQTDMAKDATVAKNADLQSALGTLALIQANMATDADLQTALGQLTALQTDLTNLSTQVGTPAQQASLDGAITTLGAIQASMATAADLQAKHDAVMLSVTNLSTQVGTPAQAAALATAEANLTALQNALAAALAAQIGTPAQMAALTAAQAGIDQALLDIADVRANMPTGSSDLSDINDKLAALQATLDSVPTGDVDLTEITAQLNGVETTLASLEENQLETGTLMAKLDSMDEAVNSAAGASAAVGLSQSAYAAASEAVTILQELQLEIKTNGKGSTTAPILLGKFGDKMGEVEKAVTVIPGELDTAAVSKQLAQLAEGVKTLASEKGYNFDSLFQMSEVQGGDVKTIRNHVTEMKALIEIQKSILENKLNEPVVKTWFEAGY